MANINRKKPEDLSFKDIPQIVWAYICLNVLPLILLLVCVVASMTKLFGYSNLSPWKNWEISALGYTLIYTIIIYVEGFRKKYFKSLVGDMGVLLGLSVAGLFFVFLLSGNEFFHLFTFSFDRRLSMVLLLITTVLFVALDFILFKALVHKHPTVSRAYFLSLKFSDVPILIAFSFLAIYAFILGKSEIDKEHMDSFFSGTIAFQMMLSNIIWTLTDDVFLDHSHSKPLTETKK